MKTRFLIPVLPALLLASGCGGDGDGDDDDDGAQRGKDAPPTNDSAQGLAGFFDPEVEEAWVYRVTREIPHDTPLTASDRARQPERTEAGHLITFERERRCAGLVEPEGASKPLTGLDIFEDGVRRGQELYDVGAKGLFSMGWIDASAPSPDDVLTDGVALALTDMEPGAIWENAGRDRSRRFTFRIIEEASVKVPAGTFDASRIQITNSSEGKSLKRTIWFARDIGIVKEESVYYGPQRVRVREVAELTRWVQPDVVKAHRDSFGGAADEPLPIEVGPLPLDLVPLVVPEESDSSDDDGNGENEVPLPQP